MEYITVGEAAQKWDISGRAVKYHLAAGRILGAVKKGKLWLIPAAAQRPADGRRRVTPAPPSLADDLAAVIAATTGPMPEDNPDAILEILHEDRLRLQYEGELAYLRGDFARTIRCFARTEGDDAARLRACPIAIAAAINLGDRPACAEIEAYLNKCESMAKSAEVSFCVQMARASFAVGAATPDLVPDWLKRGDYSAFPLPELYPHLTYLRARYLKQLGSYEAMLAAAQTALTFCMPERGIAFSGICLRMACASACHCLGRDVEARSYLLEVMRICLPHGFITPFAELAAELGGLVEQCVDQTYPNSRDAVVDQWKRTVKSWIAFHNELAKDNITLILSLREYHIAAQVARRVPYAKIAKQQGISVGRLKNIIADIYEKLFISGRKELAKFVF